MALWLVATPIGTLGDLSPRAQEVLASADAIAAEDTRTARKLLAATGLRAPELLALHGHNESEIGDRVAERARDEEIVLVSEAGTPGISDPGATVVSAAHRMGVPVRSVPGPSALAAALAATGFPAVPSTFLGFASRKGRSGWARAALERGETVVVFEAPSRVVDLLGRMAALQPEREACLCRELSKAFEEVRRDTLAALATDLGTRDAIKGECVLVIGPGQPLRPVSPTLEGTSLKDVAKVLAGRWRVTRREAYQQLLKWEPKDR
ncbi:MAG: rRNA small subunit methyltransferase 1 [Deltaproteobacteria bacterium]|nr:rRNA small subunit methyltransferase 1 [Deltaproteobacteria bacterium]